MKETFSGVMLPMIAGRLPDFGPIFERYAVDPEGRSGEVTSAVQSHPTLGCAGALAAT
jgi:hypothetical protein